MEFFNRLSQNEIYKKIMKTPLSYETGAILLGIMATAYLAIFKSTWGISGPFTVWGAKILWLIGIDTTKWSYFIAHPGLKRAIVLPS